MREKFLIYMKYVILMLLYNINNASEENLEAIGKITWLMF